jgi:PKHD-type hydroxylase
MFLQVEDFLTAAEVSALAEHARQASFVDGRRFNPHNVTKNNQVVDPADDHGQQAAQIALAAFQRNEQVRQFAFPRRIAPPQFARYGTSKAYGAHVDVAYMAVGRQMLRSDVSSTIFLSDPASYQGGELVIYLGSETVRIKGKAGHAVLYPSTTIHEVVPVTAGERMVMITFIESQIADPAKRELLYTLNEVRAIEGLKMDWRNRVQLEYVAANLQRMWGS